MILNDFWWFLDFFAKICHFWPSWKMIFFTSSSSEVNDGRAENQCKFISTIQRLICSERKPWHTYRLKSYDRKKMQKVPIDSRAVLHSGGKPSTWFPPGVLELRSYSRENAFFSSYLRTFCVPGTQKKLWRTFRTMIFYAVKTLYFF